MLWSELGRFGRGLDPLFNIDWSLPTTMRTNTPSMRTSEFPLVNIWVDDEDAILTTEIPGVDASSVDISVAGKVISLKGKRNPEPDEEGASYHRRERWYGNFAKTVELPFNVETNAVEASFQKGILTVKLPKAHTEKPRTIKVITEN
jgi:HSP20 family protein